MNARRVVALSALFTFGCATTQSPPANDAPKSSSSSKEGATVEQKKPLDPAQAKEAEKKRVADTRIALESSRGAIKDAIAAMNAAVADKKPTSDVFDRAREELAKLDKLFADAVDIEAKDEEYAREAAVARLELEKAKQEFDAKWLEVGVGLQKPALDQALKEVTLASKATTLKNASEQDLNKAETAIANLSAVIEKGAALEAKDPKYLQAAAAKKQQLEAAKKALDANKKRIILLAQQDKVNKAKAASDAAIGKLKSSTEEPAFEAANAAVGDFEEALTAGKELEDGDPNYAKYAAAMRASVDKAKSEIATRRQAQKIAVHKTSIEAARAAAKAAVAALNVEEAEKQTGELDKLLEAGKDFALTDKTYAAYAVGVTKEVLGYRAAIDKMKLGAEITADRAKVGAAATDLDARVTALAANNDAKAVEAAEQAIGALEAALKAAEPLGAKDKAYANELAALNKKLAAQRTAVTGKTTEQKIAAHRTELEAQKAKVAAALEAIKGKLEQELYLKAEDEVSSLGKLIEAGEPLGASNPKYAQELKATKDALPAQRAQMRITRIAAASAQLNEKIKALEGDADESAYSAASEAVRTLASTVESAKSFPTTDKNFQLLVAGAEKQVPLQQAAIEKRRAGAKLEKHKASVDTAAASVAEKMKALEGEPTAASFGAAETAINELKSAIESGDVPAEDKGHAAYVAAWQKKIEAYRAQIAQRKVATAVGAHKKERDAATAAIKEKLAALAGSPEEAAFSAAEEAIAALESVLKSGPTDTDPKYTKELEAAKAGIAQYRAQIEKRKTEVSVASHRAKVEEAAAAVNKEVDESSLDALEHALTDSEAIAGKDAKLAALVAALKKKLPEQRATLGRKKTAEKVAAHRTEVQAQSKKIEEAFAALKGKLDAALYQGAEDAITGLSGILEAGEPIGSEDAKYEAERKAQLAAIAPKRAQLRRLRVEAAVAAINVQMKALDGEPKPEAFDEAGDAVDVLEKIMSSAKAFSTTDKNYLAFVAATEKQIPNYRATIEKKKVSLTVAAHKAKVEAALASVTDKLKALAAPKPDPAAFDAAESAVKELEGALAPEKGTDVDKNYTAYLSAQKNKLGGYSATISKRKSEVALGSQRKAREEALAAVNEALKSIASDANEAKLSAADDAVNALEKIVETGAAEKDAAFLKENSAVKAKISGFHAVVAKKKSDVALASARKARSEALALVDGAMKAIAGQANDETLGAADDAVNALEKIVDAAASEKDAAFVKENAAVKAKLGGFRAVIAKKKSDVALASARKARGEALAAVGEALKAIAGEANDAQFAAADDAVSALEKILDGGASEKDAAFVKENAAIKAKIGGFKAQIEKRKADVALAGARKARNDALAAAQEKIKTLGAEATDPNFSAADEAVAALEKAVEAGASEKDKTFAKENAAAKAKIGSFKAQIEAKRAQVALASLHEKIGALDAASKSAVAALGSENGNAEEAEKNVGELEKILSEDAGPLAAKDKAHQKLVAAVKQKLPAYRAAIERQRSQKAIADHRAQVDAAEKDVADKLEGLKGKTDQDLYIAAEDAIANLRKVLEAGASLGEKDPAYGKKLAAVTATLPARRLSMRKTRIDAANEGAAEKIKELEAKPDEASFAAAEKALRDLTNTIESNSAAGKDDKDYAKYLQGAEKVAAALKARVDKRRAQIAVDAHKQELDGAQKEVDDAFAALKGKPEEPAFDAADKAVTHLEATVNSGGEAAEKSPEYAKRLAALKKRIDAYRSQIEQRKLEVEASGHKEQLNAAAAGVSEKLDALGKNADDAAFAAVDEAISTLESAIKDSSKFAEKNKVFAKELAAIEKKVPGYKARSNKVRSDIEHRQQEEALAAAEASVAEKLKALQGKPEAGAYDAADEAVTELAKAIDASAGAAKGDKKLGAKLAAMKKGLVAKRSVVAAARVEVDLAAHRDKVDGAVKEVEKRIAALESESSEGKIRAASGAVKELEAALSEGQELAKKSKKHAQYLASFKKKVAELRQEIIHKALADEIKSHREDVQRADEELAASEKGLEGQLEYSLYSAAEDSVSKLRKVIDRGAQLAEKDPSYAKEIAAAGTRVEAHRVTIRKKWIEAADANATAKMKALGGKPEESAFAEAKEAVRVLQNTAESGKPLAAKDKGFAAYVSSAEKKAEKFATTIERRKSELEFADVRAELNQAVKLAVEKMKALGGAKDPAAFDEAKDALDGLEKALESNIGAGEKDKLYAKRLAALKTKLTTDREKIEKVRASAELAPLRAKLNGAERALAERVSGLKGDAPAEEAFTKVDEGITELEGVLEEAKAIAPLKANVAAARKKIAAAKTAMKSKEGAREAAEHRQKVEAALLAAKEAAAGEDADVAKAAIKDLSSEIEAGRAVAKKQPKHAKFLAAMTKTKEKLSASIKKKAADARAQELAEEKAQKAGELARAKEEAKQEKLTKAEQAKKDKEAAKQDKLEKLRTAKDAKAEKARQIAEAKEAAKQERLEKVRTAKEAKEAARQEKLAAQQRDNEAKATPASENVGEEGESEDSGADPAVTLAVKLGAAQKTAKARMKALGPKPDADAVAAAREAVDELASVVEESKSAAKKSKPLAKKLAKAKTQLAKEKKDITKRESVLAKSSKKGAAVASSDEDGDSEEAPSRSAKLDHTGRLKEAWSAFAKQLKVLKAKKPTLEEFDNALEAASEVESALKEGDTAGAGKNPKYKKLATSIKKKLLKERTKIKKRRDASEYTLRGNREYKYKHELEFGSFV